MTWLGAYSAGLYSKTYGLFWYLPLIAPVLSMFIARDFKNKNAKTVLWLGVVGILALVPHSVYQEANHRRIGQFIEAQVPPGETIIANPAAPFIRRFSKRAVIADIKTTPYSDPYLLEWETRINDLGGFDPSGLKFLKLDVATFRQVARKYQARYALIYAKDPKAKALATTSISWVKVPDSEYFVAKLSA